MGKYLLQPDVFNRELLSWYNTKGSFQYKSFFGLFAGVSKPKLTHNLVYDIFILLCLHMSATCLFVRRPVLVIG